MKLPTSNYLLFGAWLMTLIVLTASTSNMPKTGKTAKSGSLMANSLGRSELKSNPSLPAPFVEKGLQWLVKAQSVNGGWGSGSHAAQNVRDPHAVKTDPATTAFVGLALLRAGNTPESGPYRESTRRATEYLLGAVEKSAVNNALITDLEGTQLQTKLGRYIDTSLTLQYLSRVLMVLSSDDPLHTRIDKALNKCLGKLSTVQNKDGSAAGGGWAPVLQSSFSLTALEMAKAAGKGEAEGLLRDARKYHKANFDLASGVVEAGAASANIELYAFAGAQRAAAAEARLALDAINRAKKRGELEQDASVSEENLTLLGVENATELAAAYKQLSMQERRINVDETLQRGFGSNGGEEFLSYLLTSESLVLTTSDEWSRWHGQMRQRLAKIQNPDGSWSGHHCITSPVFCTAAVVQCLMADRDMAFLRSTVDRTLKGE